MLWQNASATTRATAAPVVRSGTRRSSISVRTVVAPSRRRQNAAKSRSPEQAVHGLVHRDVVQPAAVAQHVVPPQRLRPERVVADPVRVAPPERGEPRVEAGRCGADVTDPDVRRQHAGEATAQGVGVTVVRRRRQVQMDHLPARVHPCVGPAGAGDPQVRQPEHGREGALELGLHGAQAGLGGPAGEVGAVVPQVEAQTDEPAVPGVGGGGLGSVVGRRSVGQGAPYSDFLASSAASSAISAKASASPAASSAFGSSEPSAALAALSAAARASAAASSAPSTSPSAASSAASAAAASAASAASGRLGRVGGRSLLARAPSWRSSWWPPRPPGRSRPSRSAPRPAR